MTDKLLKEIGEIYPLTRCEAPEFDSFNLAGMDFVTKGWKAEGLGQVSLMEASGMGGAMGMTSLIVNPIEIDAPLFNLDIISLPGKKMLYMELYDTLLTAKRNGTYDKLMQGINTSRNFMLSGYDARREIFSEIHEALGGNLECIFCGGAYLSPEIEEFMFNIGIQIRTGYGLTECAPCVTAATRYEYKFGSVGLPLECNEVMIHDPDENGVGEIWVRGDNMTPGYYNDPEATAAAFENGWLKTGDRGYLDADGYLFFTGRSKNLIILSNGKNVSPEELEEVYVFLDAARLSRERGGQAVSMEETRSLALR